MCPVLLDGLKGGCWKLMIFFHTEVWAILFNVCFVHWIWIPIHTYFFESYYSMKVMKMVLPKGNFFLLRPHIKQVLEFIDKGGSSPLKRLSFLIVVIMIYKIWGEGNRRLHQLAPFPPERIGQKIKMAAYKLNRWNFKNSCNVAIVEVLNNRRNMHLLYLLSPFFVVCCKFSVYQTMIFLELAFRRVF